MVCLFRSFLYLEIGGNKRKRDKSAETDEALPVFNLEPTGGTCATARAGGVDDVWAHRPLPLTLTETVSASWFTNNQQKPCLVLTKILKRMAVEERL